jgi:hypothetical protein
MEAMVLFRPLVAHQLLMPAVVADQIGGHQLTQDWAVPVAAVQVD